MIFGLTFREVFDFILSMSSVVSERSDPPHRVHVAQTMIEAENDPLTYFL